MSDKLRNALVLAIVIVLIAAAIYGLETLKPKHVPLPGGGDDVTHNPAAETADYVSKAGKYSLAQELVQPDGYLNTPDGAPLTLNSLIGKKVILLDFWTYSCINCQRTLPYLTAWYSKYKDQGLVIIGVHAPEFDFEKVKENVAMAVKKYGIEYPVVQDNELQTWDAYGNQYWPEHYLIDINGLVVDRHIGEGGYEETEKEIQKLLAERKSVLKEPGAVSTGVVAPGEEIQAGSPETYFGAGRNEYLGNGKKQTPGVQVLVRPATISPNTLYLTGSWNFSNEYAETQGPGTGVIYSYTAKHVYLVASAPNGVDIAVLRDGKPIGAEKGKDVDASGYVHIREARLYDLIDESAAGPHTLELRVSGKGLQAFTFTFG